MLVEANVWKDGKHWLIEAPLLDVMTQGKSKVEAMRMLADALEALVNSAGFRVSVVAAGDGCAVVEATEPMALMALALKALRRKSGLSLADVGAKLGQSSRNAYARYEQGKAAPSVDKLDELLRAVSPGQRFAIRIIDAQPSEVREARVPYAAKARTKPRTIKPSPA